METRLRTKTSPSDLHARMTHSTHPVSGDPRDQDSRPSPPPIWRHGLAAATIAAIGTTALAAIASAAGVSYAPDTKPSIPIYMFAELTLVFSLIGVGIAAVLARKARRPRKTFVQTAVALTVLSFIPDLTFGFDASSATTLIALHTVAALIVIPTLAARLVCSR